MARVLRILYPNAIYHITMKCSPDRQLFVDSVYYQEFLRGMRAEAMRRGWKVFAYCLLPQQAHLLLQTPEPNLSTGMQYWLTGYTNWYAGYSGITGHVFQGRYKTYLLENSSYLWEQSRWIHLSPSRPQGAGKKSIAKNPEAWKYSSLAGYLRRSDQADWIAYDEVFKPWQRTNKGKEPFAAYRTAIKAGIGKSEDLLASAKRGFIMGGPDYVKKIGKLVNSGSKSPLRRTSKARYGLTIDQVFSAVAKYYGVNPRAYRTSGSHATGRVIAAYLARRLTSLTIAQQSRYLGMKNPTSATGLACKGHALIMNSAEHRKALQAIERSLGISDTN